MLNKLWQGIVVGLGIVALLALVLLVVVLAEAHLLLGKMQTADGQLQMKGSCQLKIGKPLAPEFIRDTKSLLMNCVISHEDGGQTIVSLKDGGSLVLNQGDIAFISVPKGVVSADTIPRGNLHFMTSNYSSIFSVHAFEDSVDCALQIQVCEAKTKKSLGIANIRVRVKRPPQAIPSDLSDPGATPV